MKQVHVFLGIPIEGQFLVDYESLSPDRRDLFVGNNEVLLKEVKYLGKRYLGRFVPPMSSFSDLDMIEQNILSMVKKLMPGLLFGPSPLILFSFPYELSDV